MKIIIETIPHSEQRYPTVGDWQFTEDGLHIKVSDMGNWKFELLVAFHELIECHLCTERGITEEDVDSFDELYEEARQEGDLSEPGDDRRAPYYKEHFFASSLERLFADELNIDWEEYNNAVEALA